MNINATLRITLFLTIFSGLTTHAQTFLGLQHSNMSGIHQAGLNPANIANSRHKMYFNGLTAGFGFNNDYIGLNLPFPYYKLITGNIPSQYKNANGGVAFDDNWLTENLNGKPKNMNLFFQTRGPGAMFQLSKGFSVGIQYKNTISFQINDVTENLARLARYGIDSSKGTVSYSGPNQFQIGSTYGDNAFTINLNAYGEIGATVAKTIINDDNFVLKVGVTPKLLLGYATGYIKNRGLLIKAPGKDTIVFKETDVEYGYTNPESFKNPGVINFGFLNNTLSGKGFGYDVGVSFQINPDATREVTNKANNYLFRAGISLLDAGRLSYNKNMKNTRITNTSGEKYFIINDKFADAWAQGEDRGIKYTDSVMRTLFTVDTSAKKIVTTMPTTLNLQFDYNIFKAIYIGANLSQDMRGKKNIGIRKPSYLVVIPRLETKLFELALPMGMMNDYRNPRIGLYLRVGPVFIGSDNLVGQLRNSSIYGSDIYFGISTGIPTKKKNSAPAGGGEGSQN
ncbi:MAG TPA: DUF5723 family protein [Bacteroidia bacterium]